MPRQRSVRAATIGSTRQRLVASSSFSTRSPSAFRRRTVVALLVVVSLALLTVYFRESSNGGLHGVQSVGATILRPFEVAANRVAQPFEDAAGWFGDVLDAKSENARLRRENAELKAAALRNQGAVAQNWKLRQTLHYLSGPNFPDDYRARTAAVIAQPSGSFDQRVVAAAGSDNGVRPYDPVVNEKGQLLGQVTHVANAVSQITLLTDETSAVSAVDLKTRAFGIVRHDQSRGSSLILDQVTKDKQVFPGDLVITAGWRTGDLSSLYPRWIQIGTVKSVGQIDYEEDKSIRVQPFADFSSLESVVILIKKGRR